MRPLERVARKILAAYPREPTDAARALRTHWHAYDAALWYACRKKSVCATLDGEILAQVHAVERADPIEGPHPLVADIVELLEVGYLSGDGLAMRDAASGAYFKHYMPGEGDVCLDAGAHCGFVTMRLAELAGQTGCVIAVEPHPRNFAQLERRVQGARNGDPLCGAPVVLMRGALGSVAGKATLRESLGSCSHRVTPGVGSEGGTYEVDVGTIDGMGLPKLDFLKVDVEGSEWSVIRGADATINRCRPHIALEFEGAHARDSIDAHLTDADYVTDVDMVDDHVGTIWATPKEKQL